jgi:hypothetical protein
MRCTSDPLQECRIMSSATTGKASDLTPTQRREQVTKILARGLLRFQQWARSREETAPVMAEFSAAGLEVPGKTRLSVSRVPEVNRTTNQRGIR